MASWLDLWYGPSAIFAGPAHEAREGGRVLRARRDPQEEAMSDQAKDVKRPDNFRRRTFLKGVGIAGAGAVIVARRPGSASAQDATFKPDSSAKRGGTLRYGVLSAP